MKYPDVLDHNLVGTYPALAKAGGGYVWDAVLEYRVWCHPENGAPGEDDGSDYFYAFESYEEALAFSEETPGAEEPLALVLQREYISEPEPGHYIHMKGTTNDERGRATLSCLFGYKRPQEQAPF